MFKKIKKSYRKQKRKSFWVATDSESEIVTISKGRKAIHLDSVEVEILKGALNHQEQSIEDTQATVYEI